MCFASKYLIYVVFDFLNDYINNFVNLQSFKHEIVQQKFRNFALFQKFCSINVRLKHNLIEINFCNIVSYIIVCIVTRASRCYTEM